MYLDYFGLTERPFSIAPDPHYLYMSARHKEAMAHLTYGLSQGGCFIVLTGEVGTGKTTLCRNLLEDLPESVDVALILNANINERELLQTVCDELKIDYQDTHSQKQLLDQINAHLLTKFAENRQTVLIIDEAQLLQRDVLEQIRLLTNLETTKSKLLQIILIGQPELSDLLSRNDLRQLAQRVTARYHLGALQRSEIEDYVNFRLSVAGCRKPLFSRQALGQLYRSTEGIPRRINVLADHALLAAYSKNQAIVDAKSVKTASNEVFIQANQKRRKFSLGFSWWWLAMLLLMFNGALWWWFIGRDGSTIDAVVEPITSEQAVPNAQAPSTSLDQGAEQNSDAQLTPDLSDDAVSIGANDDSATSAADEPLTTIIKSDAITPGSVVIADEPLDDEPPLVNPNPIAPRERSYDVNSEFGKALDVSADVTGRTASFRALAQAWDVDLPVKLLRPACVELREQNVRCLSIASWGRLQRFNRPTIIVIEQRNQLHRAILFKIDGDSGQILIGENVHTVPVSELKARWASSAVTFWRPGELQGKLFQQGGASDDLPKVRQRLNQALLALNMPVALNVESKVFDLGLAQKVFALQTRFEILSDGKIGAETYLLMNEVLAPDTTPVLRKRVRSQ